VPRIACKWKWQWQALHAKLICALFICELAQAQLLEGIGRTLKLEGLLKKSLIKFPFPCVKV